MRDAPQFFGQRLLPVCLILGNWCVFLGEASAQLIFWCKSKAKMTGDSPFHFIELRLSKRWESVFALKTNTSWQLKVLFILIELLLSKKFTKRSSLTFTLKVKPKRQLKVLFIFTDLWLSKKAHSKRRSDILCEKKTNESWKSFSFPLNCHFQHRSLKGAVWPLLW